MLLPSGGDVALDAPPFDGAKIGVGAVASVGRYFVGIGPQIGPDPVEQRRQLRLIAGGTGQRLRHDDLMGTIDRGLGVVALNVTVLGLQDTALRVSEIALRLAVGLCLRWRRRLAGLPAALRLTFVLRLGPRLALRFGGGLGFGLQRSLGLADLLKAASACRPPNRASRRRACRRRVCPPPHRRPPPP